MRACVVNFADGRFVKGQDRLRASLEIVGFSGDLIFYTNRLPPGSPTHNESPWAFKPFALRDAQRQGYEIALWLDSSCVVVRPLDRLLGIIEREGYYLWESGGGSIGEWCADLCLEKFGISRDEAMSLPGAACGCLGLNLVSPIGNAFLARWQERASDGISFRGVPLKYFWDIGIHNKSGIASADPRVKGHKHDQVCASLIAHQLQMRFSFREAFDYQRWLRVGWKYRKFIPLDAVVIINRDVKGDVYIDYIDRWNNVTGAVPRVRYWLGAALVTALRPLRKLAQKVRFIVRAWWLRQS